MVNILYFYSASIIDVYWRPSNIYLKTFNSWKNTTGVFEAAAD